MPPLTAIRTVLRARAERAVREIAVLLAAVLLVGTAAAQPSPAATPAGPRPAHVGAVGAGAGSAPVGASPAPPLAAPAPWPARQWADRLNRRTSPAPAPAPARPPAPPAPAPAVDRWLPSGTGMWLHDWRKSEGGNAARVVARAQASGLSHLYVQTGSSRKGWIGEEVLSQLLPATKGTGLRVIAWDFPKLDDPEADARRMARAATWSRPGTPTVAAVAPDVETAAEGARATPERVRRYYAELRKVLPPQIAVLATVPWPSEKRTRRYPYEVTSRYADAFVPMAYWYNRKPQAVTATSMGYLERFGKPVMPVGQGYDGRLDAPYLPADPDPGRSVQEFVDTAHRAQARSISLWSWQTTGAAQWAVLARAAAHHRPRVVVAAPGPVAVPSPASTAPARPAPDSAPGRKPRPQRTASSPAPRSSTG